MTPNIQNVQSLYTRGKMYASTHDYVGHLNLNEGLISV